MLKNPLVPTKLPQDFDAGEEASHLDELWASADKLQRYSYARFVFAGGSGIVFQVFEVESGTTWAMKIARKKLFQPAAEGGKPPPPPFSDTEISALEQISHPNIVALHERIEDNRGVIALVTTYVDNPMPLNEYLLQTLARTPNPRNTALFSRALG